MKLLIAAIAYLSVVATAAVAVLAGVSLIERSPKPEPPVLAKGGDDRAVRRDRAIEEARVDPNRVPVWIAPTPKYDYAPPPVAVPVIGEEARGAMATAPERASPEPREAARPAPAPRGINSRRDNDPFYRD